MTLRGRERLPEISTTWLSELVDFVEWGDVRFPTFYRSSRWDSEAQRLLLQSVFEGAPIGSFVFQRKAMDAARLFVGSLVIDAEDSEALLVVDGRQRLHTLASALLDKTKPGAQLFFDPQQSAVVWGTPSIAPSHYFPVWCAREEQSATQWFSAHHLGAQQAAAVKDFIEAIRRTKVPTAFIHEDLDAKSVFARINASAASDVVEAAPGDGLDALRLRLLDADFGEISANEILAARHAIETLSEANLDWVPATEGALRRAIRCLQRVGEVPDIQHLPDSGALPTLALFFHRFSWPHPRTAELLVRWLFRGAIRGTFRSQRSVDESLSLVRESENEHEAVARLLGAVGPVSLSDLGATPDAFLTRMAGIGADDGPPPEAFLIEDEAQ